MKKSVVSVLTLLLVTVMLFTGFIPVISHAAEQKSAKEQISAVIPDRIKDTDWVDVALSGDELILTLNPDLSVLEGVDSEQLKVIIDKVLFYAKNAVKDSLKNNKQFYRDLWAIAHEAYAEYKGHNGVVDTLTDPNLPYELVSYVKAVLLAAHAADIIDVETLKDFAVSAKDALLDYAVVLKDKAVGYADDFITDKVNAILATISDAQFENIEDMISTATSVIAAVKALMTEYNLNSAQLVALIKDPTGAMTDILENANVTIPSEKLAFLVAKYSTQLESALNSKLTPVKNDIATEIQTILDTVAPGTPASEYETAILNAINAKLVEFDISIERSELSDDINKWGDELATCVIAEATTTNYINTHLDVCLELLDGVIDVEAETEEYIGSIVAEKLNGIPLDAIKSLMTVVERYVSEDTLVDVLSTVMGSDDPVAAVKSLVKEYLLNKETIMGLALKALNMVNYVSINDCVIYSSTDGPQIHLDGFKGLLLSVPGFEDIQTMEELKFSCPIVISTDYGTVDFTLTLKIHEDSEEYVRAAAALLDRYFSLNLVNGTVVFEMTVPEIFAKALRKAANSDLIPVELKQKVLAAFTATGDDYQALLNKLDFQDIITLLNYVPFDEIFDHDFVKQFVDLSAYGTEDVIRKVEQYQRYFEAAIRYGLRLANAVANRVPDRFMDNTFMDVLNYQGSNDKISYSNGTVRYEGTHNFGVDDINKVLNKVTSLLDIDSKYVSYINMALNMFLPESFVENGFTGSVDFSIHFEKINRVEYTVDGQTIRTGFLPAGTILTNFASAPGVVAWAEKENGKVLNVMPDYDVVLVPVYAEPTAYGSVTATYDPDKSYNVYVTIVNAEQYTYAWYKDGEATGITTREFTVKNVVDSGTYYCVVTGNGNTYTSNSVVVNITPASFTVSGVELDNTLVEYDGTDKTVSFKEFASELTLESVSGNVASTVGKHTVVATFSKDNGNYEGTVSLEWFIKYFIDLSDDEQFGLVWSDANTPEGPGTPSYDGTEKTVIFIGLTDMAEDVLANIIYGGTRTAVNVSKDGYKVTITVADYNDEIYHIVNNGIELTWNIAPQIINIDLNEIGNNFVWNNVADYVFGNVTTPTLTIGDAFNSLVKVSGYQHVRLDGNTAKNGGVHAGSYKTIATLALVDESGNYVLTGATSIESAEWTITPASVTIDSMHTIQNNKDLLVLENGTAYTDNLLVYAPSVTHGVTLSASKLLEMGLTLKDISGNTASLAGTYTLTVTLGDGNADDDYAYADATFTIEWKINKATINPDDITFVGKEVVYDGKYHNITIGAPEEILPLLTVKYTYGGIEDATNTGKILVGTYRVMALVTVTGNANYNDFELTLGPVNLVIKGDAKVSFQLPDNSVIVEVEGGLSPDHQLNANVTTDVKSYYEIDGKKAQILVAYDIWFTKGGEKVSLDGKKVTVKLLIPDEFRDLPDEEFRVLYIAEDGTAHLMNATRCGDYMSFTTDHFSIYAIARIKGPTLAWLWIILVVLLAGGIAVGVYFFLQARKETAPAPDEVPAVEGEATEAETETAEVTEEEAAAETEEVAEVDEVVEEETEEEIPAVDDEVTEEETEVVVDEDAAPVAEEPKTAVLVMGEDGKGATAYVGGEVVHIRFRSSFMSRLIQSTENIQTFYSEIKNHVLSYKGIKARSSWNYEAFNKGRVQLVKLNIKGKTLVVNLNLDPKEFNINKYHFVDCSDKPKFAKVPMMMKVRSGRALKYTLELIDEMMKQYEITQGEIPTVDYRMPYESTEELAKRGVVKIILPAGVTLSDDMTFVQVNVSELIESGTTVKSTEQVMTNEEAETVVIDIAPVEEAPVVEETPVVEEAPVVEETPAVEVLEEGIVHADAVEADQLISDEEAEAKIQIVTVEDARRGGKIGEINLDVICENFENGDTVDVDSLKEKHLVSPKIGRIKVLARGVMTKKLTVKAAKFSIQAVKMITLAGGKVELEE